MSTRAAALQPGPFMARSRANEARSPAPPSPSCPPPHPPSNLQLYDILPWPCRSTSSCSAPNLFLLLLFVELSGSALQRGSLWRAQRFLSFPPVPPSRLSLCKSRLLHPARPLSGTFCVHARAILSLFFVCLCISLAAAARYLRIRISSASF